VETTLESTVPTSGPQTTSPEVSSTTEAPSTSETIPSTTLPPEITTTLPGIPKLDISGPEVLVIGDTATFCTLSGGIPVPANLTFILEDGTRIRYYTGPSGCIEIYIDFTGVRDVEATKAGYIPAKAALTVGNVYARISKFWCCWPTLFIILLLLLLRRSTVVSGAVIKNMVELDRIKRYKHVYITKKAYNTQIKAFGMSEDYLKVRSLNEGGLKEAESLASEKEINIEDAEAVILAVRIRAKRIIVSQSTFKKLGKKYCKVKVLWWDARKKEVMEKEPEKKQLKRK
jgi:hypothetical protein